MGLGLLTNNKLIEIKKETNKGIRPIKAWICNTIENTIITCLSLK